MKRYVAALRRAAEVVDVPGAPRTSPGSWADYLNGVDLPPAEQPRDPASEVVPAATGPHDELPVWAVDELFETAGAHGPVVTIVNGELVGSDEG